MSERTLVIKVTLDTDEQYVIMDGEKSNGNLYVIKGFDLFQTVDRKGKAIKIDNPKKVFKNLKYIGHITHIEDMSLGYDI